ncbi:short-chain dehydrogenase (plasmid) [Rhodococcus qingshengii]|nr:short-chain dehydrogenase [Rhodococcus qingshengii]
MGRLQNKVAIITGTGGGQGRAAALLFASEGALVVGCDLDSGAADQTVIDVRAAGGEMISASPCDLTSPEECERLVQLALAEFGRVDILYNNAARGEFAWFEDMTHETFWRGMRNELDPVFLPTKAVWPHFVKQQSGVILNTASMSATKVFEVLPSVAHTTVKAAVQGFTKHLAYEGSLHGIRVNCISPGLVASPVTASSLEDSEWLDAMLRKHMIKRVGTAEEIAYAALYLVSDESSWTTAADFAVDGGATAF